MGGDAEGGLIFELWLRDSQSNFHQKIAMLYILIYILYVFSFFLYFSFVTTLLPLPPLLPIKILPQKKGLSFELWLRDSQSNFHQKIAMLYILIYIFFMFFSFFKFFICYNITPVTPVTPNQNSTPEKRSII